MNVSADAIYLPVPSSYPSTFDTFKRSRGFDMERQQIGRPRIYRLPRYDQQQWTYGNRGDASSHPTIGTIIDIHV